MIVVLKKLTAQVLGSPVVSGLGNYYHRYQPLVLLYHGVTNQTTFTGIENYQGKHIPVAAFQQQLAWLKKNFEVVSLAEVETATKQPKTRDRLCTITFDDGYSNNFTTAFPCLRSLALPATFFITTDFVDQGKPLWIDRLEFTINQYPISQKEKIKTYLQLRQKFKSYTPAERNSHLARLETTTLDHLNHSSLGNYTAFNWSQAKQMFMGGMSFGAHTMSHPILSRLTVAEQANEILGSKQIIETHLGPIAHFAYPNGQPGDWNDDTLELVTRAGWRYAWTTRRQRVQTAEHPLLLPRITISAHHTFNHFRALTSLAL